MRILYGFLIAFFCLTKSAVFGQDLLEKKISIRVNNEPIDKVLERIGNLGGFSFSYSPDAIDIRGRVSLQANQMTVREVLNEIFKGKVSFRERRRYIILQRIIVQEEKEPENFLLNGYILDGRTGEKLANVSIYESVTLASTVTNQYGYYKIKLPVTTSSLRLEVRKEEYIGKSVAVNKKDSYLSIPLNPDTLTSLAGFAPKLTETQRERDFRIEIPASTPPDTMSRRISQKKFDTFRNGYQKVQGSFLSAFASARQAINERNISDTLHRTFQASVLPFLGTNHHLSGNIVTDYSVNFIAGYGLGVDRFEIGAIANVIRGHVKGFQLAGISNIVGGNVTGFQYANALNITLGNVTGFQGSHLINFTGRNVRGVQVAGAGNVTVGVLNGYQISSGYNYAHTVRSGHQIGFVNYADSSATVPFGLFSYVRTNGYRRYEISTDELNYMNFTFKTGVTRFYNIFTVGFNALADSKPLGSFGYGFGTAQRLGKTWMANADLTGSALILHGQKVDEIAAGIFRMSLSVEKRVGNRLAFFAGPAATIFLGRYDGMIKTRHKGISPVWMSDTPEIAPRHYAWFGFQAGIRFCNKL